MNYLAIGEHAVIELLKHHLNQVKRVVVKSLKEKNKYSKYQVKTVVDPKLFNKLIKKEDIYAFAEFEPYLDDLDSKSTHILIYDLNDEGEAGTILRTAIAFNYFNVIFINSNIDLFSSKLIRSSTGARFMINATKFKDIKEYRAQYKNKIIEFKQKKLPISLEVGIKLYQLKNQKYL